jgi:hypothetical protein
MRRTTTGIAIALAVCTAGCGTYATETWIAEPPVRASAFARRSRVDVYGSAPPARPYHEVAFIEVQQTHGLNERGIGIMIDRMRTKAAAMGCDAVFLKSTWEHARALPFSVSSILDPDITYFQGICLIYDVSEQVGSFRGSAAGREPPLPSPPWGGVAQRSDREDPP